MDTNDLKKTLGEALATVIKPEDVDIEPGPAAGEIEVVTDHWTLHIEDWPHGMAWLALDSEPDSAEQDQLRIAREKVMSPVVIQALAMADVRLSGTLTAALARSDDTLSLDLAAAMRAHRPDSA